MSIQVGESIKLEFSWVDEDGVAIDPDSQSWDIVDSNGIVVKNFTEVDLIHLGTGHYKVYYDLASDAPEGLWKFIPSGIKTGRKGKAKPIKFAVQGVTE